MTKREFVREYVVRHFDRQRPKEPGIDLLVREGERLWERLSERGYGPRQANGPREHVDWYALLSDEQRGWFDEFWANFHRDGSIKRGKQRAAMRWGQINPDEQQARWMIDAAGQEADRKLPDGQSRKMPEGWLNERRWEDFAPTKVEQARRGADERTSEVRRLRGELSHVERLLGYERQPDTAQQLRDQADDLRGRIVVLEQETDG